MKVNDYLAIIMLCLLPLIGGAVGWSIGARIEQRRVEAKRQATTDAATFGDSVLHPDTESRTCVVDACPAPMAGGFCIRTICGPRERRENP